MNFNVIITSSVTKRICGNIIHVAMTTRRTSFTVKVEYPNNLYSQIIYKFRFLAEKLNK